MRVVFVDNLLFEDTEGIHRYVLQPHLGLISLIAVIERAGHEGLLFDPKVEVSRGRLTLDESLYRRMAASILTMAPDAVGMTSLGCNFICTAKVAGYLKACEPDLPILLGGPHATVLDRTVLAAFPAFDLVVRHEAEHTMLALLEALDTRAFDSIDGLTYRTRDGIHQNPSKPVVDDLDSLPIPAYHSYPVEALGLTSLRIDAGRGCPFQCTFCSTASFFGRQYRLKSAERLLEELDLLNATYGIRDFSLTHDLFTVNKRKVREFCDAVEGRGYTWKCSARMDCVNGALLERMSEAGCQSIYYGIEAGSARMQAISKKRLDLDLFDPILATTQRLGMSATTSFITGYPEEEAPDQNATLDLIGSCFDRHESPLNVQLHLLTPEPGTELLHLYRNKITYDGHISDFNFPTLESDDAEVIEGNPDVFINHHFFPSALPRDRHILVTTAYQMLYSIGFPVLRYLLARYRGEFHRLIDALDTWHQKTERPPAIDHTALEAFFEDTFGMRHHVTGLVRYMLKAAELRRRAALDIESEMPSRRVPDAVSYTLSRRAFVVRNLPDCPKILEQLESQSGKRLPGGLLRQRYDFLIYMPPHDRDMIENFTLTDASATLLEYLARERLAGVGEDNPLTEFEYDTGYPLPPSSFFSELAQRGVLEEVHAHA